MRTSPMKRFVAGVTVAIALFFLASGMACAQQKPEQAAQTSAESWLALVDSGKYAESWQESASMFKARVSKEQWR